MIECLLLCAAFLHTRGLRCQYANLGSRYSKMSPTSRKLLLIFHPPRSVNIICYRDRLSPPAPCHWAALWCVESGIVFSSRHIVQIIVNSKYICTFLLWQSVTTQHHNLVWSGLNTVCSQTCYSSEDGLLDIQLYVVSKKHVIVEYQGSNSKISAIFL